jgi:hypothetical protein
MAAFEAGCGFTVLVVVNGGTVEIPTTVKRRLAAHGLGVSSRENTGYNIGAWDHGWRLLPGFDRYLFLQDECFIRREGWLGAFVERMRADPGLGLLGESFSKWWEREWGELLASDMNQAREDHVYLGRVMPKVELYMRFLEDRAIPLGRTASHLQSLVLFTSRDVLLRTDGFPTGENYGQAVAGEIGISKQVEALGLAVDTVHAQRFRYIGHAEHVKRRRRGPDWLRYLGARLRSIRAA